MPDGDDSRTVRSAPVKGTSLEFENLLAEAVTHPVEGWDFGWIQEQGRFQESALPWDYAALVARLQQRSPDLLDLGTGGGERLASFVPHAARTVATESYAPNVLLAARRLSPLGIQVVRTSGALDNARQSDSDLAGRLPFRNGAFHLVIDRNEAFVAREVARVLVHGGTFLTEQTGSSEIPELHRLLGEPLPPVLSPLWDLALARTQLTRAGLGVTASGEADFEMTFGDVGALVWYLRAVPWALPDFSVERHRDRLVELHDRMRRDGPLHIARHGFWLEATKP
jgi:SAM-dependent methyltransferase